MVAGLAPNRLPVPLGLAVVPPKDVLAVVLDPKPPPNPVAVVVLLPEPNRPPPEVEAPNDVLALLVPKLPAALFVPKPPESDC